MRVFVSGQLADRSQVRDVYRLLRRQGHVITYDWTRKDDLAGPYSENRREAGIRAAKDIEGVLEADAYVILTSNERAGKGMYVELGAALARASTGALSSVAVIGPKNHESIFYYHPALAHFETIEEYVDHLNSKQPRLQKI